ncbi:hypothetical protein ACVWXP_005091 [Bradyrhizobium sp. USDA 4463]
MRGGLGARRKQQEHHRDHFVRRDLAALAFDLDQLCDEAFAASLARDLQLLSEIVPHLAKREQQAKEADDVRQRGHRIGPGDEARAIRHGQAEQLGDHRQRQDARIALHEIGRASFREQFRRKVIRDVADARLHREDGAAAKGFVDDVPQPGMVRLVHGQHVVGDGPDQARHPPAQAGHVAIFLAQRKSRAVLEHLCGGVVSGRDPDVADEGKTRGDHGPLRPQGRNGLWRIAKEGLAGEIEARYHGITGQVAGASTRWCAMPQVQGPEPTLLAQLD